jgi:amino acid adenylation domain-containing protein
MTLYLSPADGGLRLRLVYQRAVFAPERMACFLRHFRHLLEQVAADPDRPVDAYSLVTLHDSRVLPDPTAPIPEPLQGLVTERFAEESRRPPASAAVCQGARSWTYSATYAQAADIALELRTRGLQSGDVVAVCGSKSFGLIASMMGVLFSGGVLLPVPADLPVARKQLMVRETRARYLLWVGTDLPHHDRLLMQEDIDILSVDPSGRALDPTLPESVGQLPKLDPENPAYIFFTSGTTGVPKAVLGSHKALSHFLSWQRNIFKVGPQDRVAQLTSLSFDPVLRDVFLPLTSGATVCLPEEGLLPPENVLDWLEKERITILHTVPTLARAWLDGHTGKTELHALRCVFLAGEPLTDDLVKLWRGVAGPGCQIVNLYGPTETTMVKSYYVVPVDGLPGVQPAGGPLPNTQLLVLSDRGRQCGVGELGHIAIRTPFRTLGYLNSPDENEKRFVRNHFREDERDLMYLTGDRGRYRLDGSLDVLGRVDDQVKVRGVRVEPAEVAAVLARHPGVKFAFVGSWEPEPGRPELAAYIVPAGSGSVGVAELMSFLTENLPPAMFPSEFVFLDHMPRTPNGKVDRNALPKPVRSAPRRSAQPVPPESLIEGQVAAIWSEVLGIEGFGVDENFFVLGGNSLRAVQVIARVHKTLGSSLSVRTVFEAPTVAGLAAAIERERQAKEAIGELLLEIEALSDEEASSMLGD